MSDIESKIDKAQHKAEDAYKSASKSAKKAAHRAETGARNNPLAVIAGGIAVGALAGVLLPKTKREDELLGALGKRITEGATAAAIAARDVGKEEISSLKADSSSAKDKAGSIAAHILDAAKAAVVEAGQRK